MNVQAAIRRGVQRVVLNVAWSKVVPKIFRRTEMHLSAAQIVATQQARLYRPGTSAHAIDDSASVIWK
jgi:hypothetical protein